MSRPKNIVLTAILRNQKLGGPASSDQINSFQKEIIRDLTSFRSEYNDKIVPLTSVLPDGSVDSGIDAFKNGLDGRTLFVSSVATSALSSGRLFNSVKGRPNTVYEQVVNLFTYIDDQISDVNNSIAGLGISGSGNGLTDTQILRIGSNIFDPSLSSTTASLHGRTIIDKGNILQLARDIYGGTSPTLNTSGAPVLTNSIASMLSALLAIHGGTYDTDISLNHVDIVDSIAAHTTNVSNPHSVTLTQAIAAGGTLPASAFTILDTGGHYTSGGGEELFVEIYDRDALLDSGLDIVNTYSGFRRLEYLIQSLSDESSLVINHNSAMYPIVQAMSFDAISGLNLPAGCILPLYASGHNLAGSPAEYQGVVITHNTNNQISLKNKLDQTIVSGLVIIQW